MSEKSPTSSNARGAAEALDLLTKEAQGVTPHVEWARVEAKLFDRVNAEAAVSRRARLAQVGGAGEARGRTWAVLAVGIAAAAAVSLFVSRGKEGPSLDAPLASMASPGGGVLRTIDGPGSVMNVTDGRPMTPGATFAQNDEIDTRDARGIFERPQGANPVTWSLERESRVKITHVKGALVVALERGAVEAQVGHVDRGEAFAVDVGATRVAVHGTHLRVSREGDRAVVDLSEGVVSIGVPPRFGTTYGAVVTAPAHVEFAMNDAAGTMTIDRGAASVREPVTFAVAKSESPSIAVAAGPDVPVPSPLPLPAVTPRAPAWRPPGPSTAIARTEPVAPPAPSDPTQPARVEGVEGAVEANPEAASVQAVHACLASFPPAPGVTVTVRSTVEIRVGDDGVVKLVRFVDPLAPEVQACAAATIYKLRFPRAGRVSIPVDYQR